METLNNSNLPYEVMGYILKEIYEVTQTQAARQYEEDIRAMKEVENGDTD